MSFSLAEESSSHCILQVGIPAGAGEEGAVQLRGRQEAALQLRGREEVRTLPRGPRQEEYALQLRGRQIRRLFLHSRDLTPC